MRVSADAHFTIFKYTHRSARVSRIPRFRPKADGGIAVKDLCRRHGFSEASYYLWQRKFAGMMVTDTKRLKTLERENAQLKKLLTVPAG